MPKKTLAERTRNPIADFVAQTGFPDIAAHPEKYRLQIVYTQIDRDKNGLRLFTEHCYRTGAEYQYPASTVKFLPQTLMALT